MEKFDLYTFDRKQTGKTVERGRGYSIPDGYYRLVAGVCVFNSKNQLLIQQRTADKSSFPNLWDISCAGHITAGENSQTGASRELLEEIGINYDLTGTPPVLTVSFDHGFEDFYIIKMDVDILNLKLQQEEVQAVKWASVDEVLQMITDKTFIPYHKSLIEFLFCLNDRTGVHSL